MSDTVLLAILPALSAIIVLIITLIFQGRQKTKEYKRALLSVWFQKKVDAAQAIIAHYNLLLENIIEINVAVKRLKHDIDHDSLDLNSEYNKREHLERETAELQKTSSLDQVEAHTLFLYFDIDEAKMVATKELITIFFRTTEDLILSFSKAINYAFDSKERMELDLSFDKFLVSYNELSQAINTQMRAIKDSFTVE